MSEPLTYEDKPHVDLGTARAPQTCQDALRLMHRWINQRMRPMGQAACSFLQASPEYQQLLLDVDKACDAGDLDATTSAARALMQWLKDRTTGPDYAAKVRGRIGEKA